MPDIFVSKDSQKKQNKLKVDSSPEKIDKEAVKESKAKNINKVKPKSEPAEGKKLHPQGFSDIKNEEYIGLQPMTEKKPLAAFLFHPDGIDFETRDSEEKVILFLRKHPITNVGWILVTLIMVLAPFVVSRFDFFTSVPGNFMFIFTLIWYLLTTAYFLESFLTWFFNVYIVTDERIIDIDFYNLIYKEVSDANIDKIQDVTYKMGGVVRTLFNYGDVMIQTASEVPNFEFLAVPKPDHVARILQDLRMEEEQEFLEGRVR